MGDCRAAPFEQCPDQYSSSILIGFWVSSCMLASGMHLKVPYELINKNTLNSNRRIITKTIEIIRTFY
jgi:hypothetical protein